MIYLYLEVEDILKIHAFVIKKDGGMLGILDIGRIESAIARSKYHLNSTLIEKASVIGEELTKGHPFIDGNKRTAVMTISAFLKKNNYDLDFTKDEVTKMFCELAGCKKTKDDLRSWLFSNVIF